VVFFYSETFVEIQKFWWNLFFRNKRV